jgi:hypothetical protein
MTPSRLLIVDNCLSHRGVKAVEHLRNRYRHLTLVHAPIHASWLNQIEIYFSIVQRKVLTPNDFSDLNALAEHLLDFQYYGEAPARPFEWRFTRHDLARFLSKLSTPKDRKFRVEAAHPQWRRNGPLQARLVDSSLCFRAPVPLPPLAMLLAGICEQNSFQLAYPSSFC